MQRPRIGGAPSQVIIAWLSPDDIDTVDARCSPADAGPFDLVPPRRSCISSSCWSPELMRPSP
ncbi:MAG: hypothetical protein Q8N23_33460 [Archangium sp.]|nr:hypothetical protein [Archangium sp.]MDP3157626.1 hypothetical protein [Archangium sp.]MDP3572026.1 hypothetical protein [Archangium sp.]